MLLHLFGRKYRTILADIILLCVLATLVAYLAQFANSKTYTFSVRSHTNRSRWTKFLIKDKFKASKFYKPLPKISKLFPVTLLKPDSKHNPCKVANSTCLNDGMCLSVGNEWYCACPTTHYGKTCEFIADQTHCELNICQNNSTCYSTEELRMVPNPNVTAVKECSNEMIRDSNFHLQCNFTLHLRYKCWCKYGFEGAFCEFTEGMRCCAEDHCHYHGLIDYNEIFKKKNEEEEEKGFWSKLVGEKTEDRCKDATCTCHCEEFYRKEDNCLTPDACRDLECLNAGTCEFDTATNKSICSCPDNNLFVSPRADITFSGERCESINVADDIADTEEQKCVPCTAGEGFHSFIRCLGGNLARTVETKSLKISSYFAKDCIVDGRHKNCEEALLEKFCFNSGTCQVEVANLSIITGKSQLHRPLFLIPKCICPAGFEGDFCENQMLDECDRKDMEEHKVFLEETGKEGKDGKKKLNKFANETFFRLIKNRAYGWRPNYYDPKEALATKAFERVLRSRGMKTYCGLHGLCRPYNEEDGMGCRCDIGYKGSRCELVDPCSPNPCEEGYNCVDFPISDDTENSELTYACN